MTDEQFNTLNETIKQGFKDLADSLDVSLWTSVGEDLLDIKKDIHIMSNRGIDTYEQNN